MSGQGRYRNLWEHYYKVRIDVRGRRIGAVAVRKILNILKHLKYLICTKNIFYYVYISKFSSIFYCIIILTHCLGMPRNRFRCRFIRQTSNGRSQR